MAKLITVLHKETATTLEIDAGGRLFKVVGDTEQTGKHLLSKGNLCKRVTLIPLNKVNNRCTDAAKLAQVKDFAHAQGGTANSALELVGYDPEVPLHLLMFVLSIKFIFKNKKTKKRPLNYEKCLTSSKYGKKTLKMLPSSVAAMKKQHVWIVKEESYFGV